MEIRRLNPETDMEDLLELAQVVFARSLTSEIVDLWRWKYLPPWAEGAFSWVGTVDGRVVMHLGTVPLRGQVDGHAAHFLQLADVMVHPEHRARYDFLTFGTKSIVEEIDRQFPRSVLYGFTGRRSASWYRRLGGVLKEEARDRMVTHRPAPAGAGNGIEFRRWDWNREEIDQLWRDLETPTGLIRDRAWLGWRYAGHPTQKFRLLAVLRHGDAVGWLVTNEWAFHGQTRKKEVRLHDLLLPRGLHRTVLEEAARSLEAETVVAWLPASVWSGESRETGWVVLCRGMGQDVGSQQIAEDLYYTLGEVDQWWW